MAQYPRGLFDVGINILDAAEAVPGTMIHNFNPRSLNPAYQADTTEVQGGDVRLEQFEFNERYDMTLETAGLPLAALAAMEGSAVVTTGTGASLESKITKNIPGDTRPFFQLTAQQKDKAGGATEYFFPRATATGSPTLNMAQGEYLTPQITIQATPAVAAITGPPAVAIGDFYVFNQLATYAALA